MVTTRNTAQELARLLLGIGETPIDDGGATAVFEAITGGPLTADISVRPARDLSDEERALLGALHARRRPPPRGAPALRGRHPGRARHRPGDNQPGARTRRQRAGIAPCGHCQPQQEATVHTPLGHALRGLASAASNSAQPLPLDTAGDAGCEIAVLSSARLWRPSGWPLALVTEQIYAQFLDAYPPPWPLADADPPISPLP